MRDTVDVTRRATLIRLPEEDLQALRDLARSTRVSQSAYLREAISDLLQKYTDILKGRATARGEG